MRNFRQFEVADPFGVKWSVLFKWMQTAISLRHSDCVDTKFVLGEEGGTQIEKVISISHPDLLKLSQETGTPVTDAWVSRLAALHLKHVVETGEDLEKALIDVPYARLKQHARALEKAAA